MPVHDWRVAAAILLLAAAPLFASGQLEADPHDLYETARSHLKNGDLQAAESAIAQLRRLVAPGSGWDPDGVFAKELLPPLSAKLKRMQGAVRDLDTFCAQALEDLNPPDKKPDGSTLHDFTDWATSQIESLREKRDGILREKIADSEERAALTRTESYACTERLLEKDILKSLLDLPEAHRPDPDLAGGVSADPRVDPILVRFRQLKQDLMKTLAERDRLRRENKSAQDREAAFLAALSDIMTDGALPEPDTGSPRAKSASALFGTFLDHELNSLRQQASLSSAELEARTVDLNRYRRYNSLIIQTGLGADQSARIQALEEALERVRIDDVTRATSPWGAWLLAGGLGFLVGVFIAQALSRRRRLLSPDRAMSSPVPIHGARASRSSVDDHAA